MITSYTRGFYRLIPVHNQWCFCLELHHKSRLNGEFLVQSTMARRLFSLDQAVDMIQDDSDSGSEPNFSDSEDDFDDFDDHSDSNNSDNAQEIGPINRQVRGGPRGRKGRGRAGPRNCGSRKQIQNTDADWKFLDSEETYEEWISEFIENTGYTGDKSMANADPFDFFSLIIDDKFWNLLITETNRYATNYLENTTLSPQSRFQKWVDVTIPEMKAFMCLHLAMGLVEKPELADYWSTFWLTDTPSFSKVMPRKRFEIVLSFLHFANNTNQVPYGEPGHDKLFKICPVIDMLVPKFLEIYKPTKELSLDEMTIAFKGRSFIKQYNPKKPDKWGYKAFVLSESDTGYTLKWQLYAGKDNNANVDDDNVGATHRIVRNLVAPYINKGHIIFLDSYYTSVPLANELADQDTGICGTINYNRVGMPNRLKPANLSLRKGDDPVYMRDKKLLAVAWHDTKRVTLLSTVHSNQNVEKRIRSKDSADGFRQVKKPYCIDQYNSHMRGVDIIDQRMKTYLFPHRSRKWYMRIFNALISISVVNAHIIHTSVVERNNRLELKNFIKEICVSLLKGYGKPQARPGGPILGEIPLCLVERHWLDPTDGERPNCIVCSDTSIQGGRKQTQYRCRQCGVA